MITLSNLSVQFGGHFLFQDVNIAIKPQDRIGLIGRNGNGKSTLLRLISGEQTPETGTIAIPKSTKLGYLKQEIDNDSERSVYDEAYTALEELQRLEKRIEEITKELNERTDYESESYSKLIEELTSSSEMLAMTDASKAEKNIETILRGLGFKRSDFARSMSEFSGGWQMRVELAKILLRQPDCLMMDEPTNHLDIESIIWLEGFLKDFTGNLLVVSHDRRFLDAVTNRTIEMSRGHVYDANLPYSSFVEYREEVRTTQIAQRRNQEKQIAETERYIERFKAKARFASRTQSKAKMLEKIDLIDVDEVDIKAMKFRFPDPPRSGRVVVETKNLDKSYGSIDVLKNIDFSMERGDRVAFVGKNGEGKTTLSKIIAGVEDQTDGKSELGHNVSIGYFAQHQAELLHGDATVFEVIDNVATGEMRSKVRTLLGAFLFSGDAVYKKVRVLSGGERARLALAKLMLEPFNFLIMDEPTNHLDMIAKDVLKQALMEYEGSLLVVSHDREFLEGLTTKTFEFRNRQIHEHYGDITEFLRNRSVEDFFEYDTEDEKEKPSKSKNSGKDSLKDPDVKNLQKEKNKLEKEISALEDKISELEDKINSIENKFADHTFFQSDKYTETQKEYDKLKKELDSVNQEWEKATENLIKY
ncbi:MAG: ABC-F family ATP-binding cassette domain-containing protein [Candidatus Kapaibacteriales bacterium]